MGGDRGRRAGRGPRPPLGWLALSYWYSGDLDRATEFAERALDIAETNAYPKALVVALRCRAAVAVSRGHRVVAGALLERALPLALEDDQIDEGHPLYIWLSDLCFQRDDYAAALRYLDEVLALSRRVGDRPREWGVVAERTYVLLMIGQWDEALGPSRELTRDQIDTGALLLSTLQSSIEINVNRGDLQQARDVLGLFEGLAQSRDVQALSGFLADRASLRRAEGRLEDALADGTAAVDVARTFGIAAQASKHGLVEALEAACALGRTDTVEELLARIDAVPAGSRPPYLDAQIRRFRARLDGDAGGYLAAVEGFRHPGPSVLVGGHAPRARRADHRPGFTGRSAVDLRGTQGNTLACTSRRCRRCSGRSARRLREPSMPWPLAVLKDGLLMALSAIRRMAISGIERIDAHVSAATNTTPQTTSGEDMTSDAPAFPYPMDACHTRCRRPIVPLPIPRSRRSWVPA